jgi:hypothetical protein
MKHFFFKYREGETGTARTKKLPMTRAAAVGVVAGGGGDGGALEELTGKSADRKPSDWSKR